MKALYATVLAFLVMVPAVQGATIRGTVYNWETLEPLPNAVVSIDTTPRQSMVARDGTYIFTVPEGEYTIMAEYFVNAILVSETNETLAVPSEGDFLIDILVLPVMDDELPPSDVVDPIGDIPADEEGNDMFIIGMLLVAAFFIILIYRIMAGKPPRQRPDRTEKQEARADEAKKPAAKPESKKTEVIHEDTEITQVLEFIRKEKRLTQKSLRKEFPFSEAKMSLMLAELESDGKIKKFKKGRGNIIIATLT